MLRDLNAQQMLFVDEYLKRRKVNATAAAIAAGYSKKTARTHASKLLTKDNIQEYIRLRESQMVDELRRDFLFDALQARKVLYDIMIDPCADDPDRIRCARDFLDRAGFGKYNAQRQEVEPGTDNNLFAAIRDSAAALETDDAV